MAKRFEVGPCGDEDELRAAADIASRSLFTPVRTKDDWTVREGVGNIRLARDRGRVVGLLSTQRMGQWFGGRAVPMGGVRLVAVSPDRRGEGISQALVRAQLSELADEGVPLSALYASSFAVYRKSGFEQAGVRFTYRAPTMTLPPYRGGSVRVVTDDAIPVDQLVPAYDEVARTSNGLLHRGPWAWKRVLRRDVGLDPVWVHVARGRGGAVEGYVALGHEQPVPGERGQLVVRDLVAATPAAAAALAGFLYGHRSMHVAVTWPGGPADPWVAAIQSPDVTVQQLMIWMLRLVDVRKALEARGWPEGLDAELHLDVQDDVLRANRRRCVVAISGGKAEVRGGGRGELAIDVRGLAALYSAHQDPEALRRRGLLEGPEAARAAAARAFAGPAPWLIDHF